MAIVKIKDYRDQKVSELLNIFKLPFVDYPRAYQVKLGSESVVGGSAINTNNVEARRLHAVNQLRKWIRPYR